MPKRSGGSLPRVMPMARPVATGFSIRIILPGLPIAAPDALVVSLGGLETAGPAARRGICAAGEPSAIAQVRSNGMVCYRAAPSWTMLCASR
jgi:hypothetical protein